MFARVCHQIVLVFVIAITLPSLAWSNNDPSSKETQRKEIVDIARKYLGIEYKYGGSTPGGFDCSGFTQFILEKANLAIARTSAEQAREGNMKQIGQLNRGDLVFFGKNGNIDHVAIVIRNTERNLVVVHSTSSNGVMIEDVLYSDYWKSRLIYGADIVNNPL